MKINNLIIKLFLLFAFTTSSWALDFGVTPSTVIKGKQYSVYANLDTIAPKGETQYVRVSFGTGYDKNNNVIWSTTETKLDGSGLNWSKNFTAESTGTKNIRFRLYKNALLDSEIGTTTLNVVADTINPTLIINNLGSYESPNIHYDYNFDVENNSINTDLVIDINANDNVGISGFDYWVLGSQISDIIDFSNPIENVSTFTLPMAELSELRLDVTYTIELSAFDNSGNYTEFYEYNFKYVDSSVPQLTILTPRIGSANIKEENFTLDVNASTYTELKSIAYSIFSSSAEGVTDELIFSSDVKNLSGQVTSESFLIDIETFSIGYYTIVVDVENIENKTSTKRYIFLKPNSPISFVFPEPGSINNYNVKQSGDNRFDVNISSALELDTFNYNIRQPDSTLVTSGTLPLISSTYIDIPDSGLEGRYIMTLQLKDVAGNYSIDHKYYFYVANNAPTFTIDDSNPYERYNDAFITIDINASDDGGIEKFGYVLRDSGIVEVGYINLPNPSKSVSSIRFLPSTSLNVNTYYKLTLQAYDKLGSSSLEKDYYFEYLENPPPTLTILSSDGGSDNPRTENFDVLISVSDERAIFDVKASIGDTATNNLRATLNFQDGFNMQTNVSKHVNIDIQTLLPGSYRIIFNASDYTTDLSGMNKYNPTSDASYYYFQIPSNPTSLIISTPDNMQRTENFTLDVNASDDFGLKIITIDMYNTSGELIFQNASAPLAGKKSHSESFLINVEDLPSNEYYIDVKVTDVSDMMTTKRFYFNKASISTINIESGWNMVALPVVRTIAISELNNPDIEVIRTFKDEKWHVWTKDNIPSTDEELTSLQNGNGYWIKATNATTINISGADISGSIFYIHNDGKWHMAGSIQIDNFSEFFVNFPTIKTVWKHSQNKWFAISRDGVIEQSMQNASINPFGTITPSEGFMYK